MEDVATSGLGGSFAWPMAGDMTWPNTTGDTARPNTAGDATRPDTAGDATRPDTAGDATRPDTAGDATRPDTAGDATRPDTAGDTNRPDTAGDTIRPDTAGDATRPYTAGDMTRPDTAGDAIRPDTAGDVTWPETAGDATRSEAEGMRGALRRPPCKAGDATFCTLTEAGVPGGFALMDGETPLCPPTTADLEPRRAGDAHRCAPINVGVCGLPRTWAGETRRAAAWVRLRAGETAGLDCSWAMAGCIGPGVPFTGAVWSKIFFQLRTNCLTRLASFSFLIFRRRSLTIFPILVSWGKTVHIPLD